MAPLTEPAFARLRSVDPVLAEAAGDAAFELETDLFAALAKGIMEKVQRLPVHTTNQSV